MKEYNYTTIGDAGLVMRKIEEEIHKRAHCAVRAELTPISLKVSIISPYRIRYTYEVSDFYRTVTIVKDPEEYAKELALELLQFYKDQIFKEFFTGC